MFITPEQQKIVEQYRELFGRHLVTMSWYQQKLTSSKKPLGDSRPYSISAFVMSFGGKWCIITAGHICEELDRALREESEEMHSCSLSATMGDDLVTTNMTPFNYEQSAHHHWAPDDGSVDCGAILLTSEYCEYLKSKQVRPLFADNEIKSADYEFDHLLSLGIPVKSGTIKELDGFREASLQLTLMPLMPTTKRDPRFGEGHFYAEPKKPLTKEQVDGMSGSPIFGFSKHEKKWQYGLLAIQTNYLAEHGIVVGCPTAVFIPLVQTWLAGIRQ